MWGTFVVSCLVGAALLIVPGYLLARTLRIARIPSLCIAPVISMGLYAILGIAYPLVGMPCTVSNVAILPSVFLAAIFAIRIAVKRKRGASSVAPDLDFGLDVKRSRYVCVYILAGIAATFYVFVSTLSEPTAFSQEFDSLFHLSLVQSFIQTGNWSSLTASMYANPLDPLCNPAPGTGAYPSSWHVAAALISRSLSVPATLSINALNCLLMAVVFPVGMFLLMHRVFPENNRALLSGSIACVAFPSFPWRLLWWGPLYPTLAAFCLIPAIMAFFMVLVSRGVDRNGRVSLSALVIFGGISLVFVQPSSIFAMVLFLLPFCTVRIYCESVSKQAEKLASGESGSNISGKEIEGKRNARPVLLAVGFVLIVAAFWVAVYIAYPDRDAIEYTWKALMTVPEGILNVLFVNYCQCPWQPLLALLIVLGIMKTLRDKRCRWISVSYAIVCTILIIALGTEGLLKHVLAGFWYTDQMRIASMAAMFAMPLTALGFDSLCTSLCCLLRRSHASEHRLRMREHIAVSVAVALTVFLLFVPYEVRTTEKGEPMETSMGCMRNTLAWTFASHDVWYLTKPESQFLQEIAAEYPGEAFINNPFDGSCWAFGVHRMNVYYRSFDIYGYNAECPQSALVRTALSNIATDASVQEVVAAMPARYVLQLDANGGAGDSLNQWMYKEKQWEGINSITDTTPGFTLVKSSGDMKLYRISYFDDLEASRRSAQER